MLSAGVSDIEKNTAMDVNDVTRIGSLTKTFVAAVVLDLAEEGAFSLDDSVESLAPGLLPNAGEITVRDLLNHQSGLFEYWEDRSPAPYLEGDFAYEWAPEELLGIAASHGSQSEPGTTVLYSNSNYTALGLIIEEVTGNDLGDELSARIFEPLELASTTFETGTTLPPSHARGYLVGEEATSGRHRDQPVALLGRRQHRVEYDRRRAFNDALLEGELLDDASLEEMTTTVQEQEGLNRGLGLAHGEASCGEWYGHDGSVPGYLSAARHTESGRQIVLLVNSAGLDDTVGTPEAQSAAIDLMESAQCR